MKVATVVNLGATAIRAATITADRTFGTEKAYEITYEILENSGVKKDCWLDLQHSARSKEAPHIAKTLGVHFTSDAYGIKWLDAPSRWQVITLLNAGDAQKSIECSGDSGIFGRETQRSKHRRLCQTRCCAHLG